MDWCTAKPRNLYEGWAVVLSGRMPPEERRDMIERGSRKR